MLLATLSACGNTSSGEGDDATGSSAEEQSAEASTSGTESDADTMMEVGPTTGDGDGDSEASSTGGDGDGDGDMACPEDPDALLANWQDGTNCGAEVDIQVHQVDADTYVLRQSLCTNFEGPFLYLFFGEDTVLLEDTGAGGVDIQGVVQGVIDEVLLERGQSEIDLLVLNSHGHGDHVAGNASFEGLTGVTVVGSGVGDLADYFGLVDWPNDNALIDLGGRELTLVPIPGHHSSHVALFDSQTRWLLTGDTLYPGRLYIQDFGTYVESIEKLVSFGADLDVCAVMGTHVEMSQTPGDDYNFGASQHPDEHGLSLNYDHLVELRDGVVAMQGNPMIEVHDDFIIYPL